MSQQESQFESMTNEMLLAQYANSPTEPLRQEILMRYMYIVKMTAMQMRGLYLDFAEIDDIVNECFITLMAALDKFDPAKNVKFETYASLRIRGTVIDMVRKNDWLPRRVRKMAKDIDAAETKLFYELGHAPTSQQVAESMGMDMDTYRKALGETNLYNVVSLNEMLESYGQTMADPKGEETAPEQALQKQELGAQLEQAIEGLRENEKITISLYYRKGLSMTEIADVLGVTKPRVSQIHANAIRKLRLALEGYVKT